MQQKVAMVSVFNVMMLFFVFSSFCNVSLPLIRLGTTYGGWTIPEHFLSSKSVCYCAGAGEDISFDVLLVERYGCKVHIFDPTPRAIEHFEYVKQSVEDNKRAFINKSKETYNISSFQTIQKLFFHPVGLWSENKVMKFYEPKNPAHVSHSILNLQKTNDYFEAKCETLSTIMHKLGHKKIDLLKLDIEGAEYAVLDTILNENIEVACICIEFDEFAGANRDNNRLAENMAKAKNYLALLEQKGYRIIYQRGMTDITLLKI